MDRNDGTGQGRSRPMPRNVHCNRDSFVNSSPSSLFCGKKEEPGSVIRTKIDPDWKRQTVTYFQKKHYQPKGIPFVCYAKTWCKGEMIKEDSEDTRECIDTLNGKSWSDEEGMCFIWEDTRKGSKGKTGKSWQKTDLSAGSRTGKYFQKNHSLPQREPFARYKTERCTGELLEKKAEAVDARIIGLDGGSWSDEAGGCLTVSDMVIGCIWLFVEQSYNPPMMWPHLAVNSINGR